jgi:hypothetical protein
MALNFADLKKNRKSDFEKLQKQIDESTSKGGGQDNRFWSPTVDKAGNGYAVIRFLPAPGSEDVAFVRLFSHAFKGPTGQWYIENSRTTLGNGEKDPVGEMNSRLWNESEDDNSPQRKQARLQKRKLTYISNIRVIKDPANPENEGKVFLYKYGKKIWDKIQQAMYPEFEDETGFNPFDLWEGADFKLKIRQVEGYRNYDKSEFEKPSPLSQDDDELEAIWKSEHSLSELVAIDKFKSYDDLAKRLAIVLGGKPAAAGAPRTAEDVGDETPAYKPRERTAPAREIPSASDNDAAPWSENESKDGGDDDLAFFEKLANQ